MKMLNRIGLFCAAALIMMVGGEVFSSENNAQPQPSPVNPPGSTSEIVKMFIRFETQKCMHKGEMTMCTMPMPVVEKDADKNIVLRPLGTSNICPGPGSPNNDCVSNYMKKGYWIDLHEALPLSRRYIGIVTITKSYESSNSHPGEFLTWHNIKVEILSNGKKVAQMEGGVNNWNQLQSVKLLAEEIEDGNENFITYLNIGPSIFPEVKGLASGKGISTTNLEPMQWNVTKGKIIQ